MFTLILSKFDYLFVGSSLGSGTEMSQPPPNHIEPIHIIITPEPHFTRLTTMFAEKGYSSAIDRNLTSSIQVDDAAEEHYFKNTHPPANLSEIEANIHQFLKQHATSKIAVVSSGGTTVPLENNTVRFIDNFSAGTRGSLCAEYLLDHGYAVVFLYREFSLRPYSQHYSQKPILDWLEIDGVTGQAVIKQKYQERMKRDIRNHSNAIENNMLLEVPFTTVNQYLYILRSLGHSTQPLGTNVMFFLAAAVSDFFLPTSKVSEHKIQSKGMAKLVVDLDPVPKILKTLVQEWTPTSMVISFKLETDESILLSKCHSALEKYGHQVVIGNLLQTRKDEVYLVTSSSEEHVHKEKSDVVENVFMPKIVTMHEDYIQHAQK